MRLNRWLRGFLAQQSAGGIVMLLAAALAIALANSPAAEFYKAFVHAPLPGGIDVHFATADLLMPIFFLLVGMELKHEMQHGALAEPSQRVLPLIAALGGIALPALIYLALTHGETGLADGWAIPTATDIAFALCIVHLAGQRVPAAAKIFLLAIAIYDDLAAILIIALFYTQGMALLPLLLGALVAVAMLLVNRYANGKPLPLLLLGTLLGVLLHEAGVHTTVAGMLTGLCIGHAYLKTAMHQMHPYVAFGIMPLFALVNAGVDFSGMSLAAFSQPLPLAVALGLCIGKPLGIFGATIAAVKLGVATMPMQTSRATLYAMATIAGIGFTMSLFIGQLAFADPLPQNELKAGVMAGSLLSALLGLALLRFSIRPTDHKRK